MKESTASNHQYVDELDKWIDDEKAGFEFIDVLGKLFYENQ